MYIFVLLTIRFQNQNAEMQYIWASRDVFILWL